MNALWQRLDQPGMDHAWCSERVFGGRWVTLDPNGPSSGEYRFTLDDRWGVTQALVDWVNGTGQCSTLAMADGQWRAEGSVVLRTTATAVDLSETPATNTLAIRQLNLEVGQTQTLEVVYIRPHPFTCHVVAQTYSRLNVAHYRYQSGTFVSVLTVDNAGWVVSYPQLWTKLNTTP